MDLHDIELHGYGHFEQNDKAGFTINTIDLPSSWDYIYQNGDVLLRVDQHGPVYAQADPRAHLQWYRELCANTIQTFCVSCCGYAWYRSEVAPVQPGMKGDFLKEITALAHAEGMQVMGYFCVGANTWWGETHPDKLVRADHQCVGEHDWVMHDESGRDEYEPAS